MCFLGFNKIFFVICVHLAPNLDIILKNVSSSYKILVKFLDTWSVHAIKLTILEELQLLRQAKVGIKIFRDEITKPKSFTGKWLAEKFMFYIGHDCECWSISRHFSKSKIFVLHHNRRFVNVYTTIGTLILKHYP